MFALWVKLSASKEIERKKYSRPTNISKRVVLKNSGTPWK